MIKNYQTCKEITMKKTLSRSIVTGLCALLAACAFITVNVYFPEKDVKQAYKSLDEMLLKQDDKTKTPESTPPVEVPKDPEQKPVSLLKHKKVFSLAFVQNAYAEQDIAKELAKELSQNPEVQKAYAEIKAHIPELNALRDSGAIGEGNSGKIEILDKNKLGNNQAVVDATNNARKTVIFAMAKATLKLTGQPENDKTIKQARLDAAKTFSSVRQEKAKPGWFIQLANGRWVQK
jgi:uncharacterized protein YdbL (DUF1318 family)